MKKFVLLAILLIIPIAFGVEHDPYIVVEANKIEIVSGDVFTLNLTLQNKGLDTAYDVIVRVSTDTNLILPIVKSTDFFTQINEGNSVSTAFKIITNDTLGPGTYPITITLSYKDSDNNEFSASSNVGIKVLDELKKPKVEAFLNEVEPQPYPTGKSRFSIDVANVGSEKAYSVVVKVDSEVAEFQRKAYYVGDLDTDDFETVDFDMVIRNVTKGTYPINVEIIYNNEDDLEFRKNQTFEVSIVSFEEAMAYKKTEPVWGYAVAIIAILIIMGYIKRKLSKRKK